jgi:hypothetical protein
LGYVIYKKRRSKTLITKNQINIREAWILSIKLSDRDKFMMNGLTKVNTEIAIQLSRHGDKQKTKKPLTAEYHGSRLHELLELHD